MNIRINFFSPQSHWVETTKFNSVFFFTSLKDDHFFQLLGVAYFSGHEKEDLSIYGLSEKETELFFGREKKEITLPDTHTV